MQVNIYRWYPQIHCFPENSSIFKRILRWEKCIAIARLCWFNYPKFWPPRTKNHTFFGGTPGSWTKPVLVGYHLLSGNASQLQAVTKHDHHHQTCLHLHLGTFLSTPAASRDVCAPWGNLATLLTRSRYGMPWVAPSSNRFDVGNDGFHGKPNIKHGYFGWLGGQHQVH